VEVILGDVARKPKGVTISSLQDLDEMDPSERNELIRTLNAIKGGKNPNPGATTCYKNAGEKARDNRPTDSGKFTLTCYYCAISGHIARDCYKKARDTKEGGGGGQQNSRPRSVRSIQSDQICGEPDGSDSHYGEPNTGGTP
jgi:hypothetical protein